MLKRVLALVLCAIFTASVPISFFNAAYATEDDIFDSQNEIYWYVDDCEDPGVGGTPDGSQITVIGDSITVMSKTKIEEKLPGVDIHAKGSKWFATDKADADGGPSGLTIAEELEAGVKLRDYVVFALGTNGGVTKDDITKLIGITGTERKVILMTLKGANESSNTVIQQAATDYTNVSIADWNKAVGDGDYMADDGFHPNTAGITVFADTIYGALSAIWPKSAVGGNSDFNDIQYTSGLSAPYILEQFAIHTLKALALVKGVPESDTLTEEHVITLVANYFREGGDIANNSMFNPMNLGGGVGYTGTIDGHGSFSSFDAGVLAYAKQFGHGTQSRLGDVLIKKDSTHEDFNYAFSHFEEYPGNALWAGGAGSSGETAKHDEYTKELNDLYDQTKRDYVNRAGLVIGTTAHEKTTGDRHTELVVYAGGGAELSSSSRQAIVFLDPGHGGGSSESAAPSGGAAGIKTSESSNSPEREDALDVANRIKTKLESDGYKVVMSRTTNDDGKNLWEKGQAAEDAKADIAVSIHTTPPADYDGWMVAGQKVGNYRENADGSVKRTFDNAEVATKSQVYSSNFKIARETAEGRTINVDYDYTNSFSAGRGLASNGNIAIVALQAQSVPWVYNEIGQDEGGSITEATKEKYAEGLYSGIAASVPPTIGSVCGEVDPSGITGTTMKYAWKHLCGSSGGCTDKDADEEPTRANMKTQKQAYATDQSAETSFYEGGCGGNDCGGWVTWLIRKSGWDPEYNSSYNNGYGGATPGQIDYLRSSSKWSCIFGCASSDKTGTLITSEDQLQSGDVYFSDNSASPGHTWAYVGDIPGFGSKIASASWCSSCGTDCNRAPTAGGEGLLTGIIFRKN